MPTGCGGMRTVITVMGARGVRRACWVSARAATRRRNRKTKRRATASPSDAGRQESRRATDTQLVVSSERSKGGGGERNFREICLPENKFA
jgi:hypothetical protein